VFRENAHTAFTAGSGQAGNRSDWLVAGQIALPQGVSVAARTLFSDAFVPTLTAARMEWQDDDISLAASYIWQTADAALGRDDDVSEWSLDTEVSLNDAWTASFDTRFDAIQESPTRAGLGLQWKNECMVVDLSVSRRFTTSSTVEASTDYGLAVTLNGFSTGRSGNKAAAQCSNG
jgi:LPS-assembly protein